MKTQSKALHTSIDQQLVGARKENIRRLSEIEHRLEYVDTIDGVEFINDAKASDVNSTWYSLDCIAGPVVWIMGSCPADEDLSLYGEIDTGGIRAVIIMGSDPGDLGDVFEERGFPVRQASDIMEALQNARELSRPGDAVLYSPATSDPENYSHYKENGQRFRKAVREMQL